MKNPLTVIGGFVLLICTVLATVFTLELSGDGLTENQTNIVLLTILGLVGNAVPSLLALLKSEATQNDLRNGVVKDKVKEAIVEVAEDTDSEGVYLKTERKGDTHG